MKRIVSFVFVLAALGVFASACTKEVNPNSPTPTDPTTFFFNATALPANELNNSVPSTSPESTGRAFASVTLRVTRDGAGIITSGVLDYGVAVSSFPSTVNFTAMHIHQGDASTNGPIVVNSGLGNGELQIVNGSGSIQKTNNALSGGLAQQIINNPAGFYFNLHSTMHGGGVARGQLVAGQAQ